MQQGSQRQSELGLIIGAFAVIYFVWGATYLGNAWALESFPPFLLAGARFFIAGGLMAILGRRIWVKTTKKQWGNAFFAGVMLFAIGNGGVVFALQFVDTGIAALIIAFEPLVVVLLNWYIKKRKPDLKTLAGIALGVIGMAVLVGQVHFLNDPKWLLGLAIILVSITAWGYISIWLPTANLPESNFQSASMQMLTGGVVLLIIAAFAGNFQLFDLAAVSNKSIGAMLFLILFGSILAFTSFNFLLKKVAIEKVVTSTYVNPVVALFLGWWLNFEAITGQSLLASALLIGGVVLINSKKR